MSVPITPNTTKTVMKPLVKNAIATAATIGGIFIAKGAYLVASGYGVAWGFDLYERSKHAKPESKPVVCMTHEEAAKLYASAYQAQAQQPTNKLNVIA